MATKGKKESLQPIETIGLQPEVFQIPNPDNEGRLFTYCTFLGKYSPEGIDVWELVGIRFVRHDPLLLGVWMMHVEDEIFERWEGYAPLQEAPTFISLDLSRLVAVIEFFEALKEGSRTVSNNIPHFQRMSLDDLKYIHLSPWKIPHWEGKTYRYFPDEGVQDKDTITVFSFPGWSSQYGTNQAAELSYDMFRAEQLADPDFVSFGSLGNTQEVGVVTFNQAALEEFVVLLKQHTYERFVESQKE